MELIKKKLLQILDNFSGTKVLVIGDLMWDEYIWGYCNRISPEAPVPVVLSYKEERMPGGASNVLKNLIDLKISSGIMGVVGADTNGRSMIRELTKKSLNMLEIWESPDRPTTIKTRILAKNQQLLRLDREYAKPIPASIHDKMIDVLSREIKKYQAIILSDYDKGVFNPYFISEILKIAKNNNTYIAVDPQVRHFSLYKGADVMTPNELEASKGINLDIPETPEDLENLGKKIMNDLELEHLVITRSHKGMSLFQKNLPFINVPTTAKEVFDVTGAGDTVIAVYTSAIAAGASPLEATFLSNIAGGIVVGKIGTATVKRREIIGIVENIFKSTEKIEIKES
ncbi:MAG: D-glycero-beta-D-manno-heptose-7-phosphate kinase [Spirochaetia bacterium]|nr:D-glycero-beta-D-manno-heptose-7-phosphate kinase [Spirochaetia bacterium]